MNYNFFLPDKSILTKSFGELSTQLEAYRPSNAFVNNQTTKCQHYTYRRKEFVKHFKTGKNFDNAYIGTDASCQNIPLTSLTI